MSDPKQLWIPSFIYFVKNFAFLSAILYPPFWILKNYMNGFVISPQTPIYKVLLILMKKIKFSPTCIKFAIFFTISVILASSFWILCIKEYIFLTFKHFVSFCDETYQYLVGTYFVQSKKHFSDFEMFCEVRAEPRPFGPILMIDSDSAHQNT